MCFGPASPDAGVELLSQLFLQCTTQTSRDNSVQDHRCERDRWLPRKQQQCSSPGRIPGIDATSYTNNVSSLTNLWYTYFGGKLFMMINIDIKEYVSFCYFNVHCTSMPTFVIFCHLVTFPWKNMPLLFIDLFWQQYELSLLTFQNCSIRQLFCFLTQLSYYGPIVYDKRLLMHQQILRR